MNVRYKTESMYTFRHTIIPHSLPHLCPLSNSSKQHKMIFENKKYNKIMFANIKLLTIMHLGCTIDYIGPTYTARMTHNSRLL
jgi:hypothetical protein